MGKRGRRRVCVQGGGGGGTPDRIGNVGGRSAKAQYAGTEGKRATLDWIGELASQPRWLCAGASSALPAGAAVAATG